MPLTIPVQQEIAREISTALFSKNWASHLLVGNVRELESKKKKGSRIVLAKRQRRENPTEIEQI